MLSPNALLGIVLFICAIMALMLYSNWILNRIEHEISDKLLQERFRAKIEKLVDQFTEERLRSKSAEFDKHESGFLKNFFSTILDCVTWMFNIAAWNLINGYRVMFIVECARAVHEARKKLTDLAALLWLASSFAFSFYLSAVASMINIVFTVFMSKNSGKLYAEYFSDSAGEKW